MKTRLSSLVLCCAAVALVASVVAAQETKPPPAPVAVPQNPAQPAQAAPPAGTPADSKRLSRLEDIVAEVVKSSPDVQVAEAQLREAEAKLRQAQMQAVQKATEAYEQRMRAEKVADKSKTLLDEIQQKEQTGAATNEDVVNAQRELAEAQAEIARYGAQLQSMLGSGLKALRSAFAPETPQDSEGLVRQPRPTLDSIKNQDLIARLNTQADLEFDNAPLLTVKDYLAEYFQLNIAIDQELVEENAAITARVHIVPTRDALLALADASNMCFIIRDYGIFITTPEKAQRIAAPCIPENVPLYVPANEAEPPKP